MEEIDEKEINFEALKNLCIEDLFPKTIFYPSQTELLNENNNLSISTNQPESSNTYNSNYIVLDNRLISVPFHKGEKHSIYDIHVEENLIITCGGNYIKVYDYQDIKGGINEAKMTFYSENEIFHSLSISEIKQSDRKVICLAAGGMSSIIHLINLNDTVEFGQLIGHRNEIYDLKFHPFESDILLSASKDFSIRMWNIFTGAQIVIFGGPEGHIAEVLSIDWHLSADYFVSTAIDGYVKIWKIEENILSKIKESREINKSNELKNSLKDEKKQFKTLIKSNTMFSCNSVHENYVDCVRFNGNLILSKSVDGIIKEWLPIFNSEGDYYYLVNTYSYTLSEKIWYIKFNIDKFYRYLSIGNNKGNVLIYELNKLTDINEDDLNYVNTTRETCSVMSSSMSTVRQTAFHKDLKFLSWVNDEGQVFVNDILHK
jgi:polycomb protein EED